MKNFVMNILRFFEMDNCEFNTANGYDMDMDMHVWY